MAQPAYSAETLLALIVDILRTQTSAGPATDVNITKLAGVALTTTIPVSDAGASLSVDDAGGSLTVDGSVTVSSGSVTVSDGGGSLTVDAVSWPLPTGAATAAKQPALGTAGTPSADVISVQGVVGGTAQPVSDAGGSLTVDGSVSITGQASVLADADPRLLTAFGWMRTAEPYAAFDSKQIADIQPEVWEDAVISGAGTSATYNAGSASTTIAVSNTTAGVRVRQTYERINYQAGKSQLVIMTGVVGSTDAAGHIYKRLGQYDANNGVFFEFKDNTIYTVTRKGGVDNPIARAAWNGDKVNGAGASGMTLDLSNANIFWIAYEWLGVGSVFFGVYYHGRPVIVNAMYNENTYTTVYSGNPNNPLRWEISNDGSGAAASLTHICATVISEGGRQLGGHNYSIDRGSTALTTLNDASLYPLIAISLRASYEHAALDIGGIGVVCTSTATFRWALIRNPTVTGTALSFSNLANTAIRYDVSRTNGTTVSGGTVVASGYSQNTNEGGVNIKLSEQLRFGVSVAGVADIYVLAVQRITGTTETFYGAINIHELQ